MALTDATARRVMQTREAWEAAVRGLYAGGTAEVEQLIVAREAYQGAIEDARTEIGTKRLRDLTAALVDKVVGGLIGALR